MNELPRYFIIKDAEYDYHQPLKISSADQYELYVKRAPEYNCVVKEITEEVYSKYNSFFADLLSPEQDKERVMNTQKELKKDFNLLNIKGENN